MRLGVNEGYTNSSGCTDTYVKTDKGGYRLEIDSDFVKQTDVGNRLVIINNDGELDRHAESDLVLDLTSLNKTDSITFVGANGNSGATTINNNMSFNRLQVSDNSANSGMILDGGDTSNQSTYTDAAWTTAMSGNGTGNGGNNNILEVINGSTVSIDDLSNTKNFGKLEFTNTLAIGQTLDLQLNNTIMDQLVDTSHAASNTQVERLFIQANNNTILNENTGVITTVGAANLKIDASQVSNAFGLDILADRDTTLNIIGSAGQDHIILLGNYTQAQAGATYTSGFHYGAITNSMFAGMNNGVNYFGNDGVAGTNDDLFVKYTGTLATRSNAAGVHDTLELFGGVDISGITDFISSTPPTTPQHGFNIIAHSSVKMTVGQYNALVSSCGKITFTGSGSHGLIITGSGSLAANIPGFIEVIDTNGTTTSLNFAFSSTVGYSDFNISNVTVPSGTTANTPTVYEPSVGPGSGGQVYNSLTAIADTFNNTTSPVNATFGNTSYADKYTQNIDATLYVSNTSNLDGDILTFGTGSDKLVFTSAAQLTLTNGTSNIKVAGATVTDLEIIQLGSSINTVKIDGDFAGTVNGGGLADQLTVSGSSTIGKFAGGAGNDIVIFENGTNMAAQNAGTFDGGIGTNTIAFEAAATAVIDANFISGGFAIFTAGTFQTLEVKNTVTTSASITLAANAKIVGINKFNFNADTASTLGVDAAFVNDLSVDATGLATATKLLTVSGDSTSTVTISNLKGYLDSTSYDAGKVNVTAIGTNAHSILTGDKDDTITMQGSGNDTINAGAGNNTIDASASTGQMVSITGGAGNDIIKLNSANGKVDTIVVGNVTAAGIDIISGFKAGATNGDVFKFVAITSVYDGGTYTTTDYATLDLMLADFALGQSKALTASGAAVIQYDSKTYLMIDDGTGGYLAGSDALVELIGNYAHTDFTTSDNFSA